MTNDRQMIVFALAALFHHARLSGPDHRDGPADPRASFGIADDFLNYAEQRGIDITNSERKTYSYPGK